jgi:homocysteine S-methyltransferase
VRFRDALAARPLVLDGGLATHLEALGHDLSDDLWSARLLRDDPGAVVQAHTDHLRAGAEVLVTASYQASVAGLVAHGSGEAEARRLVASSVTRAREAAAEAAADRGVWVAGSVGPYGAVLAGGQEYTGDYLDPAAPSALGLDALRDFHAERMALLVEAGADVLACETVPGWLEVGAMLLAAEEVGAEVWVSLTAVHRPDAAHAARRAGRRRAARRRRLPQQRGRGRRQLLRARGRRAGHRRGRHRRVPEQR